MTTTVLNTKINEIENKIPDNSKYITAQEFHKLTVENFAARFFLGRIYFTSNRGYQNISTNF